MKMNEREMTAFWSINLHFDALLKEHSKVINYFPVIFDRGSYYISMKYWLVSILDEIYRKSEEKEEVWKRKTGVAFRYQDFQD